MTSADFNGKLRILTQIWLPVIGGLYFVLAKILNLAHTDVVLGVLLIVDALLGVWLYRASGDVQFHGEMEVQRVGEKTVFQMAFSDEEQLEHLADMKEVRFKVTQLEA
jgi:hypothetical protein